MRSLLFAFALSLAACGGGTTSSPAPDNTTSEPGEPDVESPLTADGRHFAADRVYEGQCAPPGSRGGCHTITLHADGTVDNMLFDAMISGTYEITDHTLVITTSDGGVEELELSDDYAKLGDLDLKP